MSYGCTVFVVCCIFKPKYAPSSYFTRYPTSVQASLRVTEHIPLRCGFFVYNKKTLYLAWVIQWTYLQGCACRWLNNTIPFGLARTPRPANKNIFLAQCSFFFFLIRSSLFKNLHPLFIFLFWYTDSITQIPTVLPHNENNEKKDIRKPSTPNHSCLADVQRHSTN